MKNWFKKLIVPSGEKTELVAYQSWTVRWHSRNSKYSTEGRPEVEIFPSEDDALAFAKQLREAFSLLRYSGEIIKVEVECNQNKLASFPV